MCNIKYEKNLFIINFSYQKCKTSLMNPSTLLFRKVQSSDKMKCFSRVVVQINMKEMNMLLCKEIK